MTRPYARHVHHPTELSQQYRVVLDEVRTQGLARIRDKDGTSLLILPEEHLSLVERDLELAREVITAFVVCRAVSRALASEELPVDIDVEGWGFIREFDAGDLAELRDELHEAAFRAWLDHNPALLRSAVSAWRTTAEVLRDQAARRTLLATSHSDDFVEVDRPADG
jgi:hypothetical protein